MTLLINRLALNYKGLRFNTEWVDYPDIAPKFTDLVPGNADLPTHACPILQFTSADTRSSPTNASKGGSEYIMDSLAIADYVEAKFPASAAGGAVQWPALYRGDEASRAAQREFAQLVDPHAYHILRPFILKTLIKQLTPRGAEYFNRTVQPLTGPFEELSDTPEKVAAAWKVVADNYAVLAKYVEERKDLEILFSKDLKKDPSGGKQPTYAALALAGVLEWQRRCGVPGIFEDILKLNGGIWREVWEAGQPYTAE